MFEPAIAQPEDPADALYVAFYGRELLVDLRAPEPCLLPGDTLRFVAPPTEREIFLGYWHGRPCFVRELHGETPLDAPHLQTANLYQILGRVSDALFALAGNAQQLLAWDRDNSFCGRCGEATSLHDSERAKTCDPCSHAIYPRISPCVIVLVSRGPDMLLARNANFPGRMFSTLAGFVEAGESVEDCLHREVREEVGVEVAELRYFGSQPWPFPNQLMLGFFAEYSGGEIRCDDEEIAEAHWFSPADLPTIPPAHSIAGRLIRDHVARHTTQNA